MNIRMSMFDESMTMDKQIEWDSEWRYVFGQAYYGVLSETMKT